MDENTELDRARVQDMIREGIELHEWTNIECANGNWELHMRLRAGGSERCAGRVYRMGGRWYTEYNAAKRLVISDGVPFDSHECALDDLMRTAAFFYVKNRDAWVRLDAIMKR